MNKLYVLLLFGVLFTHQIKAQQYIARQGHISFFSYTSVENIEAKNNQVLSIIDIDKKQIAVSMLMRAFIFRKDLMHEHFNESYIESDMYPKATFEGSFLDFDSSKFPLTKMIKGTINIHGISKEINIKTTINKVKGEYNLNGQFNLAVKDFNIKIPPILAGNIAKSVLVKLNFQYLPYEESKN
jgi:polyisoprenoid-binding protein YceI